MITLKIYYIYTILRKNARQGYFFFNLESNKIKD
jgi:hypothetical protein